MNEMKKVTAELREKVIKGGQEHLLKFLDNGRLSAKEEAILAAQLETFDFERIAAILKGSLEAEKATDGQKITPMPSTASISVEEAEKNCKEWSEVAYGLISKGKVAFIVLAGGQGTRLGFDGPKGCYSIGLPSKKTLFQLQAERLLKLQALVAAKYPDTDKSKIIIPYFIMTSPLNHAQTESYFKKNNYFGLKNADVQFFQQGTLPCITEDGKLILETPYQVATAPDGNGGIYTALASSGALKNMEKRGVKWIMACSVDNALIQVADPVFIGACEKRSSDVGNKTCAKSAWNEAVGVVGMKGGKYNVIEYSEISEEMAKSTDKNGSLLYGAGNICIHAFTLDFLNKQALPKLSCTYHIARKKIPTVDDAGEPLKPKKPNGLKLEMFIFDVFPLSNNFCNLESKREDNFAPVKNEPGNAVDSPDTARRLMFNRSKRWLEAAGAKVGGAAPGGEEICEVTPSVSLIGEGLDKLVKGVTFSLPCILMSKNDIKDIPIKGLKEENVNTKLKLYRNQEGLNIYVVS